VLSGLGVAVMALPGSLAVLVAGATLAQIGSAMYPVAARLMLVALVPPGDRREALAWQRSTANLGLVASFGLGAALGTHVWVLLLVDSVGSFAAATLVRGLPAARPEPEAAAAEGPSHIGPFVHMTAIVGAFSLVYEACLTGLAAQLRTALGPEGVSWYSGAMLVNVVACALLAVVTSRWLDDPRWSVPAGVVLLTAGAVVAVAVPGAQSAAFLGMALLTAGELAFYATGPFVWITLLPASSRQGTGFAMASTASTALKALGGALAFPLVVHADNPALGMALLGVPALLLVVTAVPVWRAFAAAEAAATRRRARG
jgi:hypothetical protein